MVGDEEIFAIMFLFCLVKEGLLVFVLFTTQNSHVRWDVDKWEKRGFDDLLCFVVVVCV